MANKAPEGVRFITVGIAHPEAVIPIRAEDGNLDGYKENKSVRR